MDTYNPPDNGTEEQGNELDWIDDYRLDEEDMPDLPWYNEDEEEEDE